MCKTGIFLTPKIFLSKVVTLLGVRVYNIKHLYLTISIINITYIAVFGVLGAFVFYLVSGASIQGTWDQMASDMAVIVLLLVMTSISMVLYFQHYKHNFSRK